MHSLSLFCTHFAPVCADKVINFHISLFQNWKHMHSNKKPSQINFLWINIWKYGMPNRESKEGFTKLIFFQMADAFINTFLHPFCTCLCMTGSYWLLVAFTGSWWLLVALTGSWWLLVAPGGSWWLLLAPGGSWWLLVAPGGSWWLLLTPAGSWWLLLTPAGSWS